MVIEDHIALDGKLTLTDQLISTITGIAPIIVASSVLVAGLNADLLDGYHASAFAQAVDTYTKNESNSRYVGLNFNSNGVAEQSSGSIDIDAQHGNKIVYSDFWTGVVPDGLFSNSGFLRISESDWFGHQEFMGYGDAWFFRPKEFEGNWSWPWFQIATREWTTANYYNKTQSDARYATAAHTHAAGDITSGTFAIGRIPTGTTATTVSLGNHTHALLTRGTGLTGSNYNGGTATTWAVQFGTTAGTVAQGNDSRILNGQTAFSWGNHALAGYLTSGDVNGRFYGISATDSSLIDTVSTPVTAQSIYGSKVVFASNITNSPASSIDGISRTAMATDFKLQEIISWGDNWFFHVGEGGYNGEYDNWYQVSTRQWTNDTFYTKSQSDSRFASLSHNHSAAEITSGTLNISRIPTGTTGTTVALGNHTHAFSAITGKPTTLAGYGITDAYTIAQSNAAYSAISHTHTFASLTSKPTTIAGYGITDVLSDTTEITINGTTQALTGNPTWSVGTVKSVGLLMPTGFSVTGSPVDNTGTLYVGFDPGYSLPTTAKQAEWDQAYTYSQAGHLPITNVSTGGLLETVTGPANRNISGILHGTWDSGTPSDTSNIGTLFTMIPESGFLGTQLYFALGDAAYFRSSVSGTWLGWNKFASTSWVNSQGFLTNADVSGVYQPLDADLTSIAGLTGAAGFLRKTAANTWELDTNTYSLSSHTHTFASLTSKPTTISGYGITDAFTQTIADGRYALTSHVHSAADITSGTFAIALIPTGTTGSTVALGNHTHAQITIGTGLTGTNYNGSSASSIAVNFGTSAGTVAQGNDSRILNGQTAFGWGNHSLAGYLTSSSLNNYVQKWDTWMGKFDQGSARPSGMVSTGLYSVGTGTNQAFATFHTSSGRSSGLSFGAYQAVSTGGVTASGTFKSHGIGTDFGRRGGVFSFTSNGGHFIWGISQIYSGLAGEDSDLTMVEAMRLNASGLTTNVDASFPNIYNKTEVDNFLTGYVPVARSIIAGNGLSGGGNLSADRTITLGTPSTITLASTNSVAGTSHTHAFAPGGTTAQYIRGDGSLAVFPAIPAGTVTSIGMTVPAGFAVSPASISTSGTFAVSFASGYSLPTTAKQTQWDTAYDWGNHAAENYVKKWDTWEGSMDVGSARSASAVTGGLYVQYASNPNYSASTFYSSSGRAFGFAIGLNQVVANVSPWSGNTMFTQNGASSDFSRRGAVYGFTQNGGHYIWAVSELFSGLAGDGSPATIQELLRLNTSAMTVQVPIEAPNLYTKTEVDNLLTGYSLSGHTHTFASLTAKPTTVAGFGITDAYTKTESDGRYVQGVAGNFLQAAGFAGSDYDLNTANSIRGHGGSASYTNAPVMSVSASAYRTVLTFDGHSVNTNAGKYKGQVAFNSAGQFSFRQEVNTVWGDWTALTPQTRSISINGVSQNLSTNSSYTIDLQSVLNAGNSATGSQMSIQGNGGTTNHIGRFGANGGWLTLYNNTSFAGQFLPTIKGETVGQGTGLSLIGQGQDTYTNAAISISARNADGTGTVISGKIFSVLNYTTERFSLDTAGYTTAVGYKTTSGTASQFLKANGTVDTTAYFPDNNDTWKYRGTYNALDANAIVLPGWYDNGSGSPSTTNLPVANAGFFTVTPYRAASFSAVLQEYATAGLAGSNPNRRFWRTSWSGSFYDWREYAAVDWVEAQGYAKLPLASVDWLTIDVANPGTLKLNVSTTNAPSAAAWHGLWIPHNSTNTYGTAIAFRNGSASIKSKENGVWNSVWNPLITQSVLNARTFTINGTAYNLGSNQVINVGDVNASGTKTEGALTMWNADGQLVSSSIIATGNTYTLGPANSSAKTIKFNFGSNEVGLQITNWSGVANMGPHAAIYTGGNGTPDGYGRLALVARPTDNSNGRIDFRVGEDRKIGMWVNWDGTVVTPYRFISTVATGTAPLQVGSTTVVTNLNADLLDGLHATDFLQVASANAFVYRANWGGMDANTMFTQSGWWANNDASPSGSNFPINQAGIFEFIRNPLGSNSGVQEHTIVGGNATNRGRKFWRTVHGGAFSAWQEYLSAEKAALTYLTPEQGDLKYGIRSEINYWTGNVNFFQPGQTGALYHIPNSISIYNRDDGDEAGVSMRGVNGDLEETFRLRSNPFAGSSTEIQFSLEKGQISVPGGDSNKWNSAYAVTQNLAASVSPPRFHPVGVQYIPKNQAFEINLDMGNYLFSSDNLSDLVLQIADNFYADKGVAALRPGGLGLKLTGNLNITIPENYTPIIITVQNVANGRQTDIPIHIATIEFTSTIPAWVEDVALTYMLSTHEATVFFNVSRDVESRVLAISGTHPSGADHDNQPWNSDVWNSGSTQWVPTGFTELARYNPTTAQMGTGGLQPDTEYMLQFREPTNPLIIYEVRFKTPSANQLTPTTILEEGGSLPACVAGPTLLSISNVTQTGLTWSFHGNGVTHIPWEIKSGATVVRQGNTYPTAATIDIIYDILQPGNYVLEIQGGNCASPVSSLAFTITGGQATSYYLKLFRDGGLHSVQWNGGSFPTPVTNFDVKLVKPNNPNFGFFDWYWEGKNGNNWETVVWYDTIEATSGLIGNGVTTSSADTETSLVPDNSGSPRTLFLFLSESPYSATKRSVTNPAEFRVIIKTYIGNDNTTNVVSNQTVNLQATSGGDIPVDTLAYNQEIALSPNTLASAKFGTGRKSIITINNAGEISDTYPDSYNGSQRRLEVDGNWQNAYYLINGHWYTDLVNMNLPDGEYTIIKLYAPANTVPGTGAIDANPAILESKLTQDAVVQTEIKIKRTV